MLDYATRRAETRRVELHMAAGDLLITATEGAKQRGSHVIIPVTRMGEFSRCVEEVVFVIRLEGVTEAHLVAHVERGTPCCPCRERPLAAGRGSPAGS
eukprot:1994031-Pyramimonas_sp.AAC.2